MRINVQTKIVDYSFDPILQEPGNEDSAMTIGGMIIQAFNAPPEADNVLPAETKVHRAIVSQEVYTALRGDGDGMVDILDDDISILKELLNPLYGPLPLMRFYSACDPAAVEVNSIVANADA